jgi:hypothetical protein
MLASNHPCSVSRLLILLLHAHPLLAVAFNPFANGNPGIGAATPNPPTDGNAPNGAKAY